MSSIVSNGILLSQSNWLKVSNMGEVLNTEPWFSVEEIAKHLGVSKESIYRWLDKTSIPAHRIGELWKFKPSQIDEWVKSGEADRTKGSRLPNQIEVSQ